MNRLQKKCLIFTAGFHLLLLVILVVGPGFFKDRTAEEDMQILTVIPDRATDMAVSSGVKAAPPPPVARPVVTPPPPVTPPAPAPAAAPPPAPPAPTMVERIKEIFTPEPKPVPTLTPDETKPVTKPKPKETHKVQISLNEVHKIIKPNTDTSDAEANAKEQRRLRREREKAAERAVAEATQAIQKNAAPSTAIDMPGDSSEAYANYGQIVKSIYDRAWNAPDTSANDNADTLVRVEISRDGSVLSADIINSSGDSAVDNSVQRALDRVRFIKEFPDGATEKTRVYKIHFNLKAKRMLG